MPGYYNKSLGNLHDSLNSTIKRIGLLQSNLDNVDTVAYKAINPDSVLFSDMMHDMIRDESQGELVETGRNFDLGLSHEKAFFMVEGANGPERTRDGNFHLNNEGKLVNFEGKELVILDKENAEIGLDQMYKTNNIRFDKEGRLFIKNNYAGRIAMDMVDAKPGERAYILQGKVEASNVDVSHNFTTMMSLKRHVDTVSNAMSMEMAMDKSLVETYGRNV